MWTRRTFLEAFPIGPLATRGVRYPRLFPLNMRDAAQPSPASARAEMMREGELVIERPLPGRPHAGKVLAAIQPHSDDLPLFAAGTVAKLVNEGYTGCLIRMSNDEKAGRGATTGEIVLNNERDNDAVAAALGLTTVFNLNYRNHRMDNESRQEIRGRLIHIFRLMVFYTQITMEAAEDPAFLAAMRRARIRGALVGVESVTPEGLKAVFKDFNQAGESLVERLQAFRQAGVHVLGSFIFGLPTDTPETFAATSDLAQRAGVSFAQFVMLIVRKWICFRPVPSARIVHVRSTLCHGPS